MINRVVLDTNILVSSLLAKGPPAAIIDMVAEGKLKMFYTDPILGEYWDVLKRPKFGFSSIQVTRLMHNIVRVGMTAEAGKKSAVPMPHEDDRVFYDASYASKAFLVTGNIKHYPREPFIVSPADFLRSYYEWL